MLPFTVSRASWPTLADGPGKTPPQDAALDGEGEVGADVAVHGLGLDLGPRVGGQLHDDPAVDPLDFDGAAGGDLPLPAERLY